MPTSSPRVLPGLGLKGFFGAGTDGWDGDMDSNLRILSALVQSRVISRVTTLPSSGLTNGDMYIVTSGAEAQKIAIRDDGAWVYIPVLAGFRVWDTSVNGFVYYNGTVWVAEGAPGNNEVLLDTKTAANTATLDFTDILAGGYKQIEFRLYNLVAVASGGDLMMRTSAGTGGTPTFDSGSSDYTYTNSFISSGSSSVTGTGSGGASAIPLTPSTASLGNASANGLCGHVTLLNPGFSAGQKKIEGIIAANRSTGDLMRVNVTAARATPGSPANVNAARFYFSNGNIASGFIECWGYK